MKHKDKFFSTILILGLLSIYFVPLGSTVSAEVDPPLNSVIIMIGDGMGPEQVEFGRLVEYGTDGESVINNFTYENTVKTNNVDGVLTDSAAWGTAIANGVKTRNGRIGMNYDASMKTTSILEIAEELNYTTGLVATCHITHATPAAFAAHNEKRGNYVEIATDIAASGVDLLFAGGSGTGYFGNEIEGLESEGYQFIDEKSELDGISNFPIIGLFEESSLPKESERNDTTIPSLSEMVEKSLELFESQEEPFFLMVEGSQIDWAGHANDKEYLAHEVIEFEKAVRVVKAFAESRDDVLLIVTADHETGGLSIKSSDFTTELPNESDTLSELRTKRTERANQIKVRWSTGGHSTTKVPLVGLGPYSERILDANHHIDTFSMMRMAIEGESGPVGEGFYDGHISLIWLYSLGGIAGFIVLIFISRFAIKKIKAKISKKSKKKE